MYNPFPSPHPSPYHSPHLTLRGGAVAPYSMTRRSKFRTPSGSLTSLSKILLATGKGEGGRMGGGGRRGENVGEESLITRTLPNPPTPSPLNHCLRSSRWLLRLPPSQQKLLFITADPNSLSRCILSAGLIPSLHRLLHPFHPRPPPPSNRELLPPPVVRFPPRLSLTYPYEQLLSDTNWT